MSKVLVVVGATGSQGAAVIEHFRQHEPAYKLRGLTRNTSSEAARQLAESGVEMVEGNISDVQSLRTAFKDATVIFAYTDFGGILRSPAVMGKFMAGEPNPPIGAAVSEIETLQGRNIADAAASVPGLERLIWSALSSVTRWSKGKYTQGFPFDAKAQITEYMLSLHELEGKVSTVQMGVFASNPAKTPQDYGFMKQDDGGIACFVPVDPDIPFPWVDVERDTGNFVSALVRAPAPTHLLGVSEFLSYNQWVSLWSAHTGVKTQFHNVPVELFTADDPSGLKRTMADVMKSIEEFGYTGGDPDVITPDELQKTVGPLPRTKIIDHIRRTDWSILL